MKPILQNDNGLNLWDKYEEEMEQWENEQEAQMESEREDQEEEN